MKDKKWKKETMRCHCKKKKTWYEKGNAVAMVDAYRFLALNCDCGVIG
jgi:hypothetical protein